MGYNFLPVERDQLFLLSPDMREWLPEDHLALFVIDAVKMIDSGDFLRSYRADGWGRAAFDPTMMITLLLYAYCQGERSSRRIERRCIEDVACRVIVGGRAPDHATIARFRVRHESALAGLFVQVLGLCAEAGLLRVGVIALDGTKLAGNASLDANRGPEALRREIDRILAEAASVDQVEDELFGDAGDQQLPAELAEPTSRLARLQACRDRLQAQADERQAAQDALVADYQAATQARGGKRPTGRPPGPVPRNRVSEAAPHANVTDPDSRAMMSRRGRVQGYNAQLMVDENQVVLAAEITQDRNDKRQFQPMITATTLMLTTIGLSAAIGMVLADSGYASQNNLTCDGPDRLICLRRERDQHLAEDKRGNSVLHGPRAQTMLERLDSAEGAALYKRRSQLVEPVIGQIKNRLPGRLPRRGLTAADSEWKLICTTHNLLKLWRTR